MRFLLHFVRCFFGAFYSAAMYRRLRVEGKGYGIGYSLGLLGLTAAICMPVLALHLPAAMAKVMPPMDQVTLGQVALVAVLLLGIRGAMVLALAIGALVAARRFHITLDRAAACRIAGVAYTPAALMDGVALCVYGTPMNPLLLFVGGIVMLLAALSASR